MEESIVAQVCGGSSAKGIDARILPPYSSEDISVGESLLVEGRRSSVFLTVVSEIKHHEGESYAFMLSKIEGLARDPHNIKYVQDTAVGELLSSKISLIPIAVYRDKRIFEADTIPDFLSRCFKVTKDYIRIFYGDIDYKYRWPIGLPKANREKEDQAFIPINIDALLRNSFAIYGKSGTGKTYMGNILASFIVGYNHSVSEEDRVSMLIFDLHSEYSHFLLDPTGKPLVEGVARAFNEDFIVFTLDEAFTKVLPDARLLKISASNIDVDDLLICSEALGLTEKFGDYAYAITNAIRNRRRARSILEYVLKEDYNRLQSFINSLDSPQEKNVFRANIPKLKRLAEYPFISLDEEDSLSEIVENLIKGKNVCIAFGTYENDSLAYLIVANVLARRIWNTYREIGLKTSSRKRLVIFLEEAHKFLARDMYFKTPFGKIARELRKRGVVLAVIDQRPSELDPDVKAMLWNKIVFNLTDRSDIREACIGLPHRELFEPIVETLRRGEALIFGSAISFPAIVKVIDYSQAIDIVKERIQEFYNEIEERRLREKGEPEW